MNKETYIDATGTVKDDNTFTDWSEPTEVVNSCYGLVTYDKWCEKEMDRINSRVEGVTIAVRDDGMIALTR